MIVVTGGTGLVGSHLLFELVSRGLSVRAIARPNSNTEAVKHIFSYYSNNADELFRQIEWVEGDVLDKSSLIDAFSGATQVYHTAAFVSFVPALKKTVLETNINGTANVVDACLITNVSKLCHVSSVAALGSSADGNLVDENSIWNSSKNRSGYSISKFHSEMEVWRGIEEGLNAVIVNPSVILAPGNWNRSSAALFSTIYKGMKFYTPGSTGYVDIRDVVKAMINLMESNVSKQRYILNAGEMGYKEVFSLIAEALHKTKPTIEVKRWMAEIAWRAEWVKSKILRQVPQITKEAISAGFNNSAFSSNKLKNEFAFEFISIEKSIKDNARLFLLDLKQ